MGMKIVPLSINDGDDIYEMLQRIGPDENKFNNEVHGMSFPEFREWLVEREAWSRGEMLPCGYVKQWIFWLYSENTPVGIGKLRECVTEESKKLGGNIGFAIDPLFRGKGYGVFLFAELLKKADELGIKEVFSTVEKGNEQSKRVHEKNGGILVREDADRWYYTFA